MNLKRTARDLLPPAVLYGLKTLRSAERMRFSGPFANWEAAAAASGGYDAGDILAKVRAAALAVRDGTAAFERDSVTFERPEPLFPHLAVMLRAALAHDGVLRVLDFGGSLGSTYFQCRGFLADVKALRWGVVEQPAFVECGRREFENEQLQFFADVESCAAAGAPHVALLSSVLQYLPDPDAVARRIAAVTPAAILVDRTPVREEHGDVIAVQHVPPAIYRASYPFRLFGAGRLETLFGDAYAFAAELPATPFESLEREMAGRYVGLLLERRSS